MKIKTLTIVNSVFIFIIVAILVVISFVLLNLEKKQAGVDYNRFISHELSEELLQSSDDLTRMARTYVNTGDSLYKKYYFAILDIRNGKIPRPQNYSKAYWYVGSGENLNDSLIHTTGESIPLRELMLRNGIQKDELDLLISAESRSNTLVRLEMEAFMAMKGLYADNAGKFTIRKDPDPDYARQLLYSKAYEDAKVEIMKPIIQFQIVVDKRTLRESNRLSKHQHLWLRFSFIIGSIGLLVIVLINILAHRAIFNPIFKLKDQIYAISKGNYSSRNDILTGNEMQALGESFNSMTNHIENWHSTLKNEVDKQTDELLQVNEALNEEIKKSALFKSELIAAKELAELYIDTVEVILVVLDTESRIVLLNRKGNEILGYSPGELLGVRWLGVCLPLEERELTLLGFDELISGENDSFMMFENHITTKSGEKRLISWKNALIKNQKGEITGTLSAGEDITERRKMENQIREMNATLEERIKIRTFELEELNKSLNKTIGDQKRTEVELIKAKNEADEANQSKSEFLSRMSHELRTPMNAVLGFAQLLEMGNPSEVQHKSIRQILNGGRHLLDLINEVLDISRIDAGEFSISIEPVRINEILDEMIDIVSPLAKITQISVDLIKISETEEYVKADKQRLKQVMINLISNAIKYNKPGGTVRVVPEIVSSQNTGMNVRISVIDTGIGILEADMKKLFMPFVRIGGNNSEVEGSGLGLAVTKKLVEAMEGTVGVESVYGEGSTFWFELPCAEQNKTSIDQSDMLEQNSSEGANIIKKTILYIEDNESNFELIDQILTTQRASMKLHLAKNGRIGIEAAYEIVPDLILLDLDLPDMHGSDVFSKLLSNHNTKDIPVVVISAVAMPKEIEKLIKAGVRDYLTKPIDVIHFLHTIDKYLLADV